MISFFFSRSPNFINISISSARNSNYVIFHEKKANHLKKHTNGQISFIALKMETNYIYVTIIIHFRSTRSHCLQMDFFVLVEFKFGCDLFWKRFILQSSIEHNWKISQKLWHKTSWISVFCWMKQPLKRNAPRKSRFERNLMNVDHKKLTFDE